jgi:LmbE family N-acetylglucosaminyl deacetylase
MNKVMVIAAHPDDEVLGCGGTIARHNMEGDEVHIVFLADGETSRIMNARPNRNLAALQASQILGALPPVFLDRRDQMLDTFPLLEITQAVEAEIAKVNPEIVYTHHAGDLNMDHRITHQAALTALRPLPGSSVRAIYAFEVLSSTEWGTGFWPNHFVEFERDAKKRKVDALACYHEEMRDHPHPRSYMSGDFLEILRGSACGLFRAEAFMTIRTIR